MVNDTHVRNHIVKLCKENHLDPIDLKHSYCFYGKYQTVLDKMIMESEDK